METINAQNFQKLALNLMFELSDEEAKELEIEFEVLQQQFDILQSIDTSGVEEMIYPFEDETVYLRSDEVNCVISQQDALINAAKVKQGHFVVPKVVK